METKIEHSTIHDSKQNLQESQKQTTQPFSLPKRSKLTSKKQLKLKKKTQRKEMFQ